LALLPLDNPLARPVPRDCACAWLCREPMNFLCKTGKSSHRLLTLRYLFVLYGEFFILTHTHTYTLDRPRHIHGQAKPSQAKDLLENISPCLFLPTLPSSHPAQNTHRTNQSSKLSITSSVMTKRRDRQTSDPAPWQCEALSPRGRCAKYKRGVKETGGRGTHSFCPTCASKSHLDYGTRVGVSGIPWHREGEKLLVRVCVFVCVCLSLLLFAHACLFWYQWTPASPVRIRELYMYTST
jgi:hypothetical protein